jgi:hypothetical protein
MNDITVVFDKQNGKDAMSIMYCKDVVSIGMSDDWYIHHVQINLSIKEFRKIYKNVEEAHAKSNVA